MRKGTTLIEVMLYVVIAGFFVSSITIFAWNAVSTKNRSSSQVVVNDAAQTAIEEIGKAIRNASGINVPATPSASANNLSLNDLSGEIKTFGLESGRIKYTAGDTNFYITPENVDASELSFTNLSKPGSLGAISVHLKLTRKNPNGLTELSAESEINTTISLRN